jgi:hypothetical protein
MAYWSKYGPAGFNTTTHDWTIVTLNILATAAFGESWDFVGMEKHKLEAIDQRQSKTDSDMEMSSRESIAILASNVRLLTLTLVLRCPALIHAY